LSGNKRLRSIGASGTTVDSFFIDLSSGWDVQITQLTNNYFANNKFSFTLPNKSLASLQEIIYQSSAPNISLNVQGTDAPFNGFDLKFTIGIDGENINLNIATEIKGVYLSNYFPVFENSLADNILLSSLRLELDSRRNDTLEKSCLYVESDTYYCLPVVALSASINIEDRNNSIIRIPVDIDIYNLNSDIHFKTDLNAIKDDLPKIEDALKKMLGLKTDDIKDKVATGVGINKTLVYIMYQIRKQAN
jgi:hypothetical protein